MTTNDKRPSQRVMLLKAASNLYVDNWSWSWIKVALSKDYYGELNIHHCLYHALETYTEILAEPRYQIGSSFGLQELIKAPVKFPYSASPNAQNLNSMFGLHLNDTITVDEYFDSLCRFVLSLLTVCAVDWCKDEYNIALEKLTRE